jgi:hypothetical protein
MTRTIQFILICLLAFSCNSSTEDEIERILLDCLTEDYKEKGVNISDELDTLEQFLIDTKTLNDRTGQSYYDFFEQVSMTGEISAYIDNYRFEKIFKEGPDDFYDEACLEQLKKFDSVVVANSKYGKLTLAIQKEISKENSPASAAKAIVDNLTPSDFEKPYYRASSLLVIAHTGDQDQGILRELKPREKHRNTSYEGLEIRITAEQEIYINDTLSDTKILLRETTDFIRKHKEEHIINFLPGKGTSYQFYLDVQDIIHQAYEDLRNGLAQELFSLPYSELNDERKSTVKLTYPMRIDESGNK